MQEQHNEAKEIINDKVFDLYTHMKMNIKCYAPYCEIHDSKYTHYCLNCKRSVCEVCKDSFHSTHVLQYKKAITFEQSKMDFLFKELEELINNTRVFTEPEKMKRELVGKVNEEFDEIDSLLRDLKKRKMKEIELVFGDNGNAKHLINNIKLTKGMVFEFFNKYNTFYFNDEIKDEDNLVFLMGYDIFNLGITVSKEYSQIINQIRSYYLSFEQGKNKRTEDIYNSIQFALEIEKKNEILNTNLLVIDNSESNNVDTNKEEDKQDPDGGFKIKVVSNFEKLGEDLYKELKERIEKMTDFLEGFKKSTFDSFKKHNSLIDIEKIVKTLDEKTNKRTTFIKGKTNLKFSPSQAKAYSITGALPSTAKMTTQAKIKTDPNNPNSVNNTPNSTINNTSDKGKVDVNSKGEKKIDLDSAKLGSDTSQSSTVKKAKQKREKLKDSKLLKDIKIDGVEIPKIKLAHFGGTTQKKNFKAILDPILHPDQMEKKEGLSELEERTEEDAETVSKFSKLGGFNKNENSNSNSQDDDEDEDNLFDEEENDSVKLENGFHKPKDKLAEKREKMFKPIIKKQKRNGKTPKVEKKQETEEEKKFKINNKLQDMIKENQKLCGMIKKQDDINLIISTIRRYYSYQVLDYVRKNFYKVNKGYSSNLLFSSAMKEEIISNDNVKVFEGTNELQIYDRDKRKLIRKSIALDKKVHGSSIFLDGCRTFYVSDKLYINGGKDSHGDKNVFWLYNIKDNKLSKLPSMLKPRSYHSMQFHENLKSMVVIGGENNKTCEMYDFFLNSWSELPELNIPRSNVSMHIDKIGSFAYAVGGITGGIANGSNSDVIELLDLVDLQQGWAKVEYRNKANVDLKFSTTGVYSLTDDKLLIYGGSESRNTRKCYVIFDLRSFSILPIDKNVLDVMRIQTAKNPELSRIFG